MRARPVPFPKREEEELARKVRARFKGTRKQWEDLILPLLLAGQYDQALERVNEIAASVAAAYPSEQIAKDFGDTARKVDKKHKAAFWGAIAGATGLAVYVASMSGKVTEAKPIPPAGRARPRGQPRLRIERPRPRPAAVPAPPRETTPEPPTIDPDDPPFDWGQGPDPEQVFELPPERGYRPTARERSAQERAAVLIQPTMEGEIAVKGAADRGVNLISTVRDGVADGMRQQIEEAVERIAAGEDKDKVLGELAKHIRENGLPAQIPIRRLKKNGVPMLVNAEAHAMLIARDQVGKAQAYLERERAQIAGLTTYVWRTQGDGRVRSAHREREGKQYPYGVGEQPGDAVQCRCIAEPVVEPEDILNSSGVVQIPDGHKYKEEAKALARAQSVEFLHTRYAGRIEFQPEGAEPDMFGDD